MARIQTLSIGQVAERTGLSVSAVRYYEDLGLVTAIRSPGGNRRFLRSDIRKIAFITVSQNLGFPLSVIGQHLQSLPDNRAPNRKDWQKISQGFRQTIDERIAQLERLRDRLDGCIGCGCLSMETCGIYNQADKAARLGPGAQLITRSSID